jgi:hypothetical protein
MNTRHTTVMLLLISFTALASEHSDEARYLKAAFLKNNHVVQQLPDAGPGQATAVSKRLSSHFSSHADPTITGSIDIGELQGRMHLEVASTSNLLYQQKKATVRFTASAAQGSYQIYSPVDMDFWQMAKLFIDTPDKYRPDPDPWQLTGYVVYTIEAGKITSGQANLIPLADEYHLLLVAEKPVQGVQITLK